MSERLGRISSRNEEVYTFFTILHQLGVDMPDERWLSHYRIAVEYEGVDPSQVNWSQNWFHVGPLRATEIEAAKRGAEQFLLLVPERQNQEIDRCFIGYQRDFSHDLVLSIAQLFASVQPGETVNWKVDNTEKSKCDLWLEAVRV